MASVGGQCLQTSLTGRRCSPGHTAAREAKGGVGALRASTTSPPRGLATGLSTSSSCRRVAELPNGAAAARRGGVRARALVDPSHLADVVGQVALHLPLAYEPVALPCSMMKCGDVLHRSTLDLELRGEVNGPDWRTFVLLATVGAYLFMPPGVLPGAFDYYVLAKMRNHARAYSKEDITLGRKLATGGFGTVFRGTMKMADGTVEDVIVKKAKEFGQAEAWMNERMTRLGGGHVAEFVTAFDETLSLSPEEEALKAKKKKQQQRGNPAAPLGDGAVWLVWKYEGDNTLFDLMESKDFPYNLEPLLLDRELRLPKGVERRAVTIRLALKQLIEGLAAAHSTGIVHRDVKPQNCIISERDNKIKLIDLGAAADLRVGINYAPNEYLMDPRYAPPQQYVMSTQTPKPPPAPVAAFLSPVLWRMENPDRFDMYSCGVTLLQMAFPHLRNDNALIAFNKRLEGLKYDLRAWRAEEEGKKGGMKPDVAEGFALLDLDNGAGWNLLNDLMAFKPTERRSAADALVSPFFTGSGVTSPTELVPMAASRSALSAATRAINKTMASPLISGFVNSATGQDRGSLTEAQLKQELGLEEAAPMSTRRASNTIVWWKERQSEMRKSIEKRQGEGSQGTTGLPIRGASVGRSKSVSVPGAGSSGSNGNGNGRGASPASSQQQAASQQQQTSGAKVSLGAAWLGALTSGIPKLTNGNGNGNGSGPAHRNGNGNGPAQRNGNGNGKVSRSPEPSIAAAALLRSPLILNWRGGESDEDSSASSSSSSLPQRNGGGGNGSSEEEDQREVELVGQRQQAGGAGSGLGFLSNVLAGVSRGRSSGSNN